MTSREELELIIRARAMTDRAFKEVRQQLQGIEKEQKTLNQRFKDFAARNRESFMSVAKVAGIATIAIGATTVALGALIERGSKVTTVQSAFARSVEDSTAVLGRARAATLGLISDFQLQQRAVQASALGLDTSAESFAKLAETAAVLGQAVGKDVAESFDRLILGIGKGEAELLDELGLVVRAEEAYRKYAAAHDLVASKLTLSQRQQALVTEALSQAAEVTDKLGEVQLTMAGRIDQVVVSATNFADALALAVTSSAPLTAALAEIAEGMMLAFGNNEALIETTVDALEDGARLALMFGKAVVDAAALGKQAWDALRYVMETLNLAMAESVSFTTNMLLEVIRIHQQIPGVGRAFDGLAETVEENARTWEIFADKTRQARDEIAGSDSVDDALAIMSASLGDALVAMDNADDTSRRMGDGFREAARGAEETAEAVGKATAKIVELQRSSFATGITGSGGQFIGGGGIGGLGPRPAQSFGVTPLQTNALFAGMDPDDLVPTATLSAVVKSGDNLSHLFEGLTLVTSAVVGEFDQVPQIIDNTRQAFEKATDGAGKFAAIASGVAQLGGLIGGKAGGAIQGAAGGALSGFSVGGPLGAAIGGGLGLIGGLFGGPSEEEGVNDLRDDFFSQFENGFIGLQEKLQGLTNQDLVKKIFDAETVAEFNAAVGEAMGLLDTQAAAQQKLKDIVGEYNFAVSEMGPTFRNQELDQMAGRLIERWQVLNAAQFDTAAVLRELGPEMQSYVEAAMEAGTAIPEALRGPIEQLIAQGALLDENGNAFESLEQTGLTFTETVSEGLGRLIDKLDEFIAILSGGIPAVEIPVRFGAPQGVPGGLPPDFSGFREGGPPPGQGFANEGFVPFTPGGGRSVRVGEQNTERIVSDDSLAAIVARAGAMGGGGRGGAQKVQVELRISPPEFARWFERQSRSGAMRTHPDSVTRAGT